MKKYNNIDELFKEHASGFQIEPSDKVWQNIGNELQITSTSNNRIIMLWVLALLILIIGSVSIWRILSNDSEQSILINPNISNITSNNLNKNLKINTDIKTISTSETSTIHTKSSKTKKTNNNSNHNVISVKNNYSSNDKNNSNTKNNEEHHHHKTIATNNLTPKNSYAIENQQYSTIIDVENTITVEEYLEKRKNLHFYTGASTSVGITYYSVSTDQITWTADLTYGLKLKQYYIESGIGFQKMKEQGIFQIDYKTNDSVGYYNKVLSFEVNPNNPNEITYKTQTTTVYDSIEHHLLKSPLYIYDYLTIPIKFGYKFFQRDQFSISAETGIIYNLLTKTYMPTVTYNDPESQLIGISNNTPKRVEHNFRIHIALRLNYNITKTISLSAQPEFTRYINSIYDQPNGNQTKPYTMGIRFGILFDF